MRRILLKFSGEALKGPSSGDLYDVEFIDGLLEDIQAVHKANVDIAVVVGGGNVFRGALHKTLGMPRVSGDHVGMLATMMNGVVLSEMLRKKGIPSVVLSALPCPLVCETYTAALGRSYLDKGYVVICVGGTSLPYITTDTAAVLRALELGCDALMKGTKCAGVFDKDPQKHTDAVRYETMTHAEILAQRLQVMDLTAVELAHQNNLPITVFSLFEKCPLSSVLEGQAPCTKVTIGQQA